MIEIIQYSTSGFWKFLGSISILYLFAYFAVNGVVRIFLIIFRTISISIKGWPPNHLDQNGDNIKQEL